MAEEIETLMHFDELEEATQAREAFEQN